MLGEFNFIVAAAELSVALAVPVFFDRYANTNR